jgi:hypothetical protein
MDGIERDGGAELRRPDACPACRGDTLLRILYGFPTQDAFERIVAGEAVSGGCSMEPWQPDWQCQSCGHRWFDPEDPAKQEFEALAGRVRRLWRRS